MVLSSPPKVGHSYSCSFIVMEDLMSGLQRRFVRQSCLSRVLSRARVEVMSRKLEPSVLLADS